MRESKVEKEFKKHVEALGGMCEKFISPGKRSVPDRIVTLPGNKIIFVELKAPKKDATSAQARDHKKRRALGCDVRVIDSLEAVNAFPN